MRSKAAKFERQIQKFAISRELVELRDRLETAWEVVSALALLDLSDIIPDAVHLLLGRRYRGRGLLTARELEEEAQRRGRHDTVSGALAAVTS